jgi:hypothetical protein
MRAHSAIVIYTRRRIDHNVFGDSNAVLNYSSSKDLRAGINFTFIPHNRVRVKHTLHRETHLKPRGILRAPSLYILYCAKPVEYGIPACWKRLQIRVIAQHRNTKNKFARRQGAINYAIHGNPGAQGRVQNDSPMPTSGD